MTTDVACGKNQNAHKIKKKKNRMCLMHAIHALIACIKCGVFANIHQSRVNIKTIFDPFLQNMQYLQNGELS